MYKALRPHSLSEKCGHHPVMSTTIDGHHSGSKIFDTPKALYHLLILRTVPVLRDLIGYQKIYRKTISFPVACHIFLKQRQIPFFSLGLEAVHKGPRRISHLDGLMVTSNGRF